jgi:hypothetical protein
MNIKLLFILLTTVVLLLLSAIIINFLTNDKNINNWLLEQGIGTKEFIVALITVGGLLLIFEYFKFRNRGSNEPIKSKSGITQNQRSGDNSQNYQAGGDITINNTHHQEFTDNSKNQELLARWTEISNVNITASGEKTPDFPVTFPQYRSAENNKDYWNTPFSWNGTIRIFEGQDWTEIGDFPHTMNHCSDGVFMMRWRSANPDVSIETAVAYSSENIVKSKIGKSGFMYGNNCEQPMFKFADTINNNESNLVDIYYEIMFWKASP